MVSKCQWRDKWSVCIMTATQLAVEIYKFRMSTLEYDRSRPLDADSDETERPPMTAKQKAELVRQIFVSRVQAFMANVMDMP